MGGGEKMGGQKDGAAKRWEGKKMGGQKDGAAKRWGGKKMGGQKDGRAKRWEGFLEAIKPKAYYRSSWAEIEVWPCSSTWTSITLAWQQTGQSSM